MDALAGKYFIPAKVLTLDDFRSTLIRFYIFHNDYEIENWYEDLYINKKYTYMYIIIMWMYSNYSLYTIIIADAFLNP